MAVTDQSLIGVFGAHGAQGSAILRALIDRGVRMRGLVRRYAPTGGKGEYLRADMGDPTGFATPSMDCPRCASLCR